MNIDRNKDWSFKSQEIAEGFNDHVREQLPWYEFVKSIIIFIIRSYINKNGVLYDIGCSTGNLIRGLGNIIKERNIEVIGIDESKEMLELFPSSLGTTYCGDALDYDYKEYDVAVLFLVSMFFDTNKRAGFLQSLYDKKKKNGIIILVDKFVENDNSYFSMIMNRFNMLLKLDNNVEPKEILNKELSLTGIQIPLTYNELPKGKECEPIEFFRVGDFRGYVLT
jgi:tRNA (cmo5U34)-methyltransferase